MESKIVMHEVYSAQEMQGLVGCTITSVTGPDDGGVESVCLDCKDNEGNLVSFLILEDGTWHFHDDKEEKNNKLLFCDGCGRGIRVGDNTIGFDLHERPILIHKNLDCLLKLDEVSGDKISCIGNTHLKG